MFRLTSFMRALVQPARADVPGVPRGPVVIWNLVRRCNLACRHCYSISADVDFPGELTREEVFAVMDDLGAFGVPVLILSGGEPLLRHDILEIAARAKSMGFYVGLSTNGTLIDAANVAAVARAGFDYVGISLDGDEETHDRFRRSKGAYRRSLQALRLARDAGIKVGVRFTLTQENAHDLPAMLELVARERIGKFYLSHLNYAGRGNVNRAADACHETTRRAMDLLLETCWRNVEAGAETEFVTGNNDADGVYFLSWVRRRFPEREAQARARLARWGGNASGVHVANIDNLGNVHPDTMWGHHTLGNVRERPFSEIWRDTRDPLMAGLKARPRRVKGRCARCVWFDICGGNTRVRAEQLTGDPWQEDPGCYLTDGEIGADATEPRLTVTRYTRRRSVL